MNGLPATIVIRHLIANPTSSTHRPAARTPYRFEPGEPDDLESGANTKRGTLALLVTYALVIAVIVAVSWIVGTDLPGQDVVGDAVR